jgi:hypothetical protein
MIRVEITVVADHQNIVLGHAKVEFKGGHPDPHRGCEGRERILWRKPASTTMSLEVECVRVGTHDESGQGSCRCDDVCQAAYHVAYDFHLLVGRRHCRTLAVEYVAATTAVPHREMTQNSVPCIKAV